MPEILDEEKKLAIAHASYQVARIEEPLIRDIEFEFGEAIGGHRNAQRALQAVFMAGWLQRDKPETQAALDQLTKEIAHGDTESNQD